MTTPGADDSLRELLLERIWFDDGPLVDATARTLASRDPGVDSHGGATQAMLEALGRTWQSGWQPADVAHVVRRQASAPALRLALALIAEDARLTSAASRAPTEWVHQLRALGSLAQAASHGVHSWHQSENRSPTEAWRDVLVLAGRLRLLFPVPVLLPPPSRWDEPQRRVPDRDRLRPDDGRVLRRVRGLLAKAESTDFPEEADALTAKAQELMSTHMLDAALLESSGPTPLRDGVRSRRLHVDGPYIEAKMNLLARVGVSNGVRTVWYRGLGIATVVGMTVDVDAVELLFTSLLIQAVRAMNAGGTAGGATTRSAAFRRSFLLAYGHRIGERLAAARFRSTEAATAAGVAALPVLHSRQQAVDEVYGELFADARGRRSRAFDAAGWGAGRRAGDSADLSGGRDRLPG